MRTSQGSDYLHVSLQQIFLSLVQCRSFLPTKGRDRNFLLLLWIYFASYQNSITPQASICVCMYIQYKTISHAHTSHIRYILYCLAYRHYISIFLLQCSTENSTQLRILSKQKYTYRVKVVNRAKKSEYTIKWVKYTEKFGSVEDVCMEL